MTIALSRQSPVPLYYQLESVLRDEIVAGRYAAGTLLPTEENLTRRFGVSRITVRRAMERLVSEGLIYRVPGRGTFVGAARPREFRIERNPADLMGFDEDIRRLGIRPETRVLRREWVQAPAEVVESLGIPKTAEMLRLYRLGTAGGRPLWIEDRYVVRTLAGRLRPSDLAVPSLLATLARAEGLTVDRAQVEITARGASREESRHLALRPGAPVLVAEFAVHAGGRPAQFVRARFRPDRYGFAFTIAPGAPLRRTPRVRSDAADTT
ncbi:MAG TPA: GntR family transcriptional regulator [bacterium]|nr:GntR family transcriptional regulator [bacterium]